METVAGSVRALSRMLIDAPRPSGASPDVDAERIDLLSALETLKNTAAGLQAQLAVDLDSSVRAQHAAAGVPAERQGQGVAAQLALARRESPHRGQQLLGLAKDLRSDLPHTFAALRRGQLNEFRATVVARESGCLGRADRQHLDAALFTGNGDALTLGTRQLAAQARALTYRLDPAAAARRSANATADRCVSVRPAPDTMVYLTTLCPVEQGVAAYAALTRQAATARAAGDERGKGQLMADLLIEHVLSADTGTSGPSFTVDLIMSEETLLGSGHDPALLLAAGAPAVPVPAQHARELLANALDEPGRTWLRRLYADPDGQLVAMTSRQRFAPHGLADFLRIRDQGICRTSWCDAPIAESDHIRPATDGGTTTAQNGQGYCIACNRTKQAPGWRQYASGPVGTGGATDRHVVDTITPTGHRHRSAAPRVA